MRIPTKNSLQAHPRSSLRIYHHRSQCKGIVPIDGYTLMHIQHNISRCQSLRPSSDASFLSTPLPISLPFPMAQSLALTHKRFQTPRVRLYVAKRRIPPLPIFPILRPVCPYPLLLKLHPTNRPLASANNASSRYPPVSKSAPSTARTRATAKASVKRPPSDHSPKNSSSTST